MKNSTSIKSTFWATLVKARENEIQLGKAYDQAIENDDTNQDQIGLQWQAASTKRNILEQEWKELNSL